MARPTTRIDDVTGRVAIPDVDPEDLRFKRKPAEFTVAVEGGRTIEGLAWSNDKGEFFASERRCPHNPAVHLKRGQIAARREGQDCQAVECSVHKWKWSERDGAPIWWDEEAPKPRELTVWRVDEENGVLYLLY